MIIENNNNSTINYEFLGLSTDQKPIEGVALNSIYYEIDTGNFYQFNGTFWVLYRSKK